MVREYKRKPGSRSYRNYGQGREECISVRRSESRYRYWGSWYSWHNKLSWRWRYSWCWSDGQWRWWWWWGMVMRLTSPAAVRKTVKKKLMELHICQEKATFFSRIWRFRHWGFRYYWIWKGTFPGCHCHHEEGWSWSQCNAQKWTQLEMAKGKGPDLLCQGGNQEEDHMPKTSL